MGVVASACARDVVVSRCERDVVTSFYGRNVAITYYELSVAFSLTTVDAMATRKPMNATVAQSSVDAKSHVVHMAR